MNLQAIYHKPKSNFCYAYNENVIHIRLRAEKGDIKKVFLVYGDKYNWNEKQELVMKLTCSDDLYDYFTIEVTPKSKRLAYYFKIEGDNETFYFTEWGLINDINEKEVYLHFFQYPYLNKEDIHIVPEWVKDTVFYQIFPERFFNGDTSNDPDKLTKWGELPTSDSFYGGDLKGIINKLDYLEELGINGIYLTPIFEAPTNHKYDTKDYFKVDSHFGDLEILKELVSKCHERGIKVILDAVFNHCGYFFEPFQDVIKRGEKSPYYDWFHIHKWPIETNPPSYDTFAFTYYMPKLNTANPEVRDYLLKVARYWIDEADIDGWRLDVSDEVSHAFWREFRRVVKEAKEDAYIIGELWLDAYPWLKGDQFDAVMNYPLMRALLQYFAYENISNNQFKELINKIIMRNTMQVNEVMFNLIESHDTSRFLTECNKNVKKLMMAATFLFTYIGTPCIYYGTEIGMEGGYDPDCRRPMEWDKRAWNLELFNYYKKLIKIRKQNKVLRRGSFEWINDLEEIIGFIRKYEEEKVFVLINNYNFDKKVTLKIDGKYIDVLTGEIFKSDNNLDIDIPMYSARILISYNNK
ncbi:Glycosidase [Caminicella sporogenes DSM 14501]|uniref:Glycosidase n=1 Tax=Caminicella sporogenes DSM 14501 TaxID=1121266 RepID=A0A1M6N2L5_9FIRM|nr:glycoside hydrolase family 13 protein [Caminicella sporogenes]RKD22389.1 alpha-glycosidase [Caminicella sporogenes]SHJ89925.1 Glycosidase [Caminicella sporogenes DSM 14501]